MKEEQKLNSDLAKSVEFKEALKRLPTSFRIASWLQNSLIVLSEKTGIKVAKIIEVAITEYLKNRGAILLEETDKIDDGKYAQLEKLSPSQLYNLLCIHLRRVNNSFDFKSDTGIDSNAKGFQYYNSAALLDIFRMYFKKKKLEIPSIELLVKDAALGYRVPAFGGPKLVSISDEELREILLAVAK